MKKLNSDYLIKYFGHEVLEDKYLYIYMEYMNNGSLQSLLEKQNEKPLDEITIK